METEAAQQQEVQKKNVTKAVVKAIPDYLANRIQQEDGKEG